MLTYHFLIASLFGNLFILHDSRNKWKLYLVQYHADDKRADYAFHYTESSLAVVKAFIGSEENNFGDSDYNMSSGVAQVDPRSQECTIS